MVFFCRRELELLRELVRHLKRDSITSAIIEKINIELVHPSRTQDKGLFLASDQYIQMDYRESA
jgi:hypothetical protein